MKKFTLPFVLATIVLLASCNNFHIEKRHYRNGFYVDLGHNRDDHGSVTSNKQESAEVAFTTHVEEPAPDVVPQEVVPAIDHALLVSEADDEAPAATSNDDKNVRTQDEMPRTVIKQGDEQSRDSNTPQAPSDTMLIIEVILAIIIPPLAVFLHEGITARFWITLILCLLGGGFIFYPVIGGLWFIAAIIALLVVLDAI